MFSEVKNSVERELKKILEHHNEIKLEQTGTFKKRGKTLFSSKAGYVGQMWSHDNSINARMCL